LVLVGLVLMSMYTLQLWYSGTFDWLCFAMYSLVFLLDKIRWCNIDRLINSFLKENYLFSWLNEYQSSLFVMHRLMGTSWDVTIVGTCKILYHGSLIVGENKPNSMTLFVQDIYSDTDSRRIYVRLWIIVVIQLKRHK
jgi:hypothetical protein